MSRASTTASPPAHLLPCCVPVAAWPTHAPIVVVVVVVDVGAAEFVSSITADARRIERRRCRPSSVCLDLKAEIFFSSSWAQCNHPPPPIRETEWAAHSGQCRANFEVAWCGPISCYFFPI